MSTSLTHHFFIQKSGCKKPAAEGREHKQYVVLVSFRPHMRYMWELLHDVASVCVLSTPIHFDTPGDEQFSRSLPILVCLVRSGNTDVAPSACHSATTASFARLRTCGASFTTLAQKVWQCTGSQCEIISFPISGAALCAAETQRRNIVLGPARVTTKEFPQLLIAEHPLLSCHHSSEQSAVAWRDHF
jgi:hypothetical protein